MNEDERALEIAKMTEYILEVFGKRPSWFTRIRYGIKKMYIAEQLGFYEAKHPTLIDKKKFSAPYKWFRVMHISGRILLDYARRHDIETIYAEMIHFARPLGWHMWYDELTKIYELAKATKVTKKITKK